ncbi:MAG: NADP-dependent oxidoreductase [Dehalococcoidia bacterium]
MSQRMRAATQYAFGGPEVFEIVEVDRPEPGAGEVLVRLKAASVNFGDTKIRAGKVPEVGAPPITLGSDLSGIVEQVAPDVTRFRPGEEVYGILFLGTYAEYAAVPAGNLAVKPPGLDHVHAAALPVAALTAWRGIVDLAEAQEGQRILIHAAAGGVGHLAVQIAKMRGAYVIGTARAAKHDFLRDLGADELIDYTAVDFTSAVRDVDVVVDLVGGEYGPRSLNVLRPGGLLLGAALDPGITAEKAEARGRRYAWISVQPSGIELERISELVQTGRLRVSVQRTFALEELAQAHELSDRGQVTGKLVITL